MAARTLHNWQIAINYILNMIYTAINPVMDAKSAFVHQKYLIR